MAQSLAYNADCMEAMRQFPNGFFDLAVVDPPYGDGCSQIGNVERERERERTRPQWNRFGQRFDRYKTVTEEVVPQFISKERTADNRTEPGVMRVGGTWGTKYAKKLWRGM